VVAAAWIANPITKKNCSAILMAGQFIADSFIAQMQFIETLEATAGQNQSSCFGKKGTANFASRNAESRPLWLARINHALPPKDNLSAQAKLERSISLISLLRAGGSRDCTSDAEKISTSSGNHQLKSNRKSNHYNLGGIHAS
jgi:hypothetical protein